jgi:hypothetical protein
MLTFVALFFTTGTDAEVSNAMLLRSRANRAVEKERDMFIRLALVCTTATALFSFGLVLDRVWFRSIMLSAR